MKRSVVMLLAAILMLAMAFTLTGCGSDQPAADNGDNNATQATDAPANDAAISAEDLIFTYDGASVELNTKLDDAIAALGEANDVSSQLSCHGVGDDKTYTYDGFVVNSYPNDGVDYVLEVIIKKPGIPTGKGIEIGSSAAEVIAAYGEGYKAIGHYYAYNDGTGKSLRFLIENDAVEEIDYYYNV